MKNEENPALVLLNVHNRTSARDGIIFGSMGPSMYTTSLEGPVRIQYKCLVPIYVFQAIKLRGLVISKT
jgi:hypothetical protein